MHAWTYFDSLSDGVLSSDFGLAAMLESVNSSKSLDLQGTGQLSTVPHLQMLKAQSRAAGKVS